MKVDFNETTNEITFEWDPNDPVEQQYNSYSGKDFLKVLLDACEQIPTVPDDANSTETTPPG